ncbi:FAD/NAD(P)-binding domain-containing protein [Neolentinus lepideus HHB14362 ss-1]|uniref:FAD/NAD(P)-binding domain-containing protein n=1 Tax=Neolentinus lepideus HHB14362 ss-1 TaxID=1314782 RepID=A0A165VST8_9AGAM|nr:FAD/NAD(P)-binding domain-containing protein [Neolentinus lepideus HHB14362 ss-1]
MNSVKSDKRNIVVVGGSYVGLKAVEFLANAMHESHNILLIEKNSHFHACALLVHFTSVTLTLPQHLFAFPRFAVLPGYEHLAFIPYSNAFHACPPGSSSLIRGLVSVVSPGKVEYTEVLSSSQEKKSLDYDYLVVATGTYMPPIAGKKEGIEGMKVRQEAVRKAQRVVVVGGGAVGVQTATDIKDIYPAKSVTLIHSRDRLMQTFHPKMHEVIMDRCTELGIDVILGDRVKVPQGGFPTDGSEFEVELTSGRKVPADLAFMSTGQPPAASFLPRALLSPTTGRVLVKPTLQLQDPAYAHVFAIGDVAETGGPRQARPGFKQAEIVSKNVRRLYEGNGEGQLETYKPDLAGIHLSLGIKRNIKFREPASAGGEPTYSVEDDGQEDVGAASRAWKMWAPGVQDYYS